MWFGECPGCYQTIVKPNHAGWREVPEGQRVQWKSGRPTLVAGQARTGRRIGRVQRFVRGIFARIARLFGRRPLGGTPGTEAPPAEAPPGEA